MRPYRVENLYVNKHQSMDYQTLFKRSTDQISKAICRFSYPSRFFLKRFCSIVIILEHVQ